MANEQDYVDLGLPCGDICKVLKRGLGGKTLDILSQSVCDAINQLTTWAQLVINISSPPAYDGPDRRTVAEIQGNVLKRSGRHGMSRFFRSISFHPTQVYWIPSYRRSSSLSGGRKKAGVRRKFTHLLAPEVNTRMLSPSSIYQYFSDVIGCKGVLARRRVGS